MSYFENLRPAVWRHNATIDLPPDEAYEAFADTDRFSRLRGAGQLKISERALESGAVERRIRLGDGEEYVEEPFEWEYGKRYSVLRHYDSGMLAGYTWEIEFIASGSGTELQFCSSLYPRSSWMRPLLALFANIFISREIDKIMKVARASAAKPRNRSFVLPAPIAERTHAHEARLERARAELIARPLPAAAVEALLGVIRDETDLELMHIKPLALAHDRDLNADEVVATFLHGTRAGYLELRWSLICPLCRGAKGDAEDLSRLNLQAHCDSCNISFDADFESSVQVTFRPAAALRPIEDGYFCVGGPMRTPHIHAQRSLEPGDDEEILSVWRASMVQPQLRCTPNDRSLIIDGPGHFELSDDGLVRCGEAEGIRVRNASGSKRRIIVEDTEPQSDILTAATVIQNQLFRDLFSEQTLSPEAAVALRPVAFMFSDLKGSTAMYEATGDAASFGKVKAHFDILLSTLADHSGTLVKTIGDAVMATFEDPADGMRCAIAMQRRMKAESDLTIKLGLHYGRAMAVTLNDRLDYFGATVNRSARLEGQSKGGDVVCSRAVYDDPEVSLLLKKSGLDLQHESVQVKGVEEPMQVVRIQVVEPT